MENHLFSDLENIKMNNLERVIFFHKYSNAIHNIEEFKLLNSFHSVCVFFNHNFTIAIILFNKLKNIGLKVKSLTYPKSSFIIKCKDNYFSISFECTFMKTYNDSRFNFEIMSEHNGEIKKCFTDEVPYSDNNIYNILEFIDNQYI